MDFEIKLEFTREGEFMNIKTIPSCDMDIEEIIYYLERAAEGIRNPTPDLRIVK